MINSLPFCSRGKACKLVCCSRHCTSNPFVCRIDRCQCDQPHANCKYLNWQALMADLQNKLADPSMPVFLAVEEFYKASIEELQAELENFREYVKVMGLTPKEQEFLRILKQQQHNQLTGKFIFELEKDLEVQVSPLPYRSREEVELDMMVWRKQLHSLFASVKAAYGLNASTSRTSSTSRGSFGADWGSKPTSDTPFRSIANEQSFARNSKLVSTGQHQKSEVSQQVREPSRVEAHIANESIISSKQTSHLIHLNSRITGDLRGIIDLFKPKTVKDLRLLFRASQHDFSTALFHHYCDIVPNTLTLVKTEFGCVIGGFTPLIWNKARDGNYETDAAMESFIFSLTLKEKMQLRDPSRAIANDAKFGPVFGSGHDLAIADLANRCTNSMAQFPASYNSSYSRNQQSIQQLTGQSKGSGFKVLEWEVFEVCFG